MLSIFAFSDCSRACFRRLAQCRIFVVTSNRPNPSYSQRTVPKRLLLDSLWLIFDFVYLIWPLLRV
jgi:hypothetical protein